MTKKDVEKKPISLEEIKEKAKGVLVAIPDWNNLGDIYVRVRYIDISPLLLNTGAFPNELSLEVETMFEQDDGKRKPTPKEDTKVQMDKFMPILEAVAKEALIEPTYDEIQEVYPLTFQQKTAIFKHIMGGIEQLKPFR